MRTPSPVFFRLSRVWGALVVLLALALLTAAAAPTLAEDHAPIIDVPNGDAEMNAAIAKARASLPVFWASYEAPKLGEAN
ncbi:hypothetical protein ABTL46_21520, partial [Acinetobacter baumannii]